jgi:hypothetical protein
VDNVDCGKILLQALGNPRRRAPEFEAMVMADKKFHEAVFGT